MLYTLKKLNLKACDQFKLILFATLFLFAHELTAGTSPVIQEILINGNHKINKNAILSKLAFAQGDTLDKCKQLSSTSLKNLAGMGYFKDHSLNLGYLPGDNQDKVKVVINLEEKALFSGYEFAGNSQISVKKLKTQLNIDSIIAIDQDDANRMCKEIERMYKKINYLSAKATARLEADGQESLKLIINIEEGTITRVQKVNFIGCKSFPEHKLRNILQTKEDWILGALNGAGKLDKDLIEHDKRTIEEFYRNHGYLKASVSEVQIKFAENKKDLELIFCIEEGSVFTVNKVGIPYDDSFNPLKIEYSIVPQENKTFSNNAIRESIKRLESTFGEEGYVFANVYHEVIPDEKKSTVDINFKVDKGEQYRINEIDITGNAVTKDYVIRRELLIQEGEIANKTLMHLSLRNVEFLDYFERDSVDWKMHKVDDGKVNLELMLKEKKTGNASVSLNIGQNSTGTTEPSFDIDLSKRNLLGYGFDVSSKLKTHPNTKTSNISTAFLDFENPHLFDQDLHFAMRGFLNKSDINLNDKVSLDPVEDTLGVTSSLGFYTKLFDQRIGVVGEIGFENVTYNMPKSFSDTATTAALGKSFNAFMKYQKDLFVGGDSIWLGGKFVINNQNYVVDPTKGWKVEWRNKVAFSDAEKSSNITSHSLFKSEIDASFYWPLVKQNQLIFSARTRLGFIQPLGDSTKTSITQKDLFHVGGVYTVRGYTFGQAGPGFKINDNISPIGSKAMFVTNFELTAPLGKGPTAPHGILFYDMGTGWNSQKLSLTSDEQKLIDSDEISFRHSVGFGVKLAAPIPIRVEYGYKLNRRGGEKPSELHLTMSHQF